MGLLSKKAYITRIVAIIAVLVVVLVSFYAFMNVNSSRIVSQNALYVKSTSEQLADRVNDLVSDGETTLSVVSGIIGNSLTDPTEAEEALDNFTKETKFDGIIFITKDGDVYNSASSDVLTSQSEYIRDGMQGNAGVCVVENEDAYDGGDTMVFYTPQYYDNEFLGVLAGIYNARTLSEYLITTFMDTPLASYICEREGRIISRSIPAKPNSTDNSDLYNGDSEVVSVLDNLEGSTYKAVVEALYSNETTPITYVSNDKDISACVVPLEHFGWELVSVFPPSVTNSMVRSANFAGMVLLVVIMVAFVAYLLLLVIQYRKSNTQLLNENAQIQRVVNASTNLFMRYAVFDFKKGTYEYLKSDGVNGDIPDEGPYIVFENFWVNTIEDDETRALMDEALRIETLQENLKADIPFLRYEFCSTRHGIDSWLQVSIICINRDSDGRALSALYAVQDVTDVKKEGMRNHQALVEAHRAAEHASAAKSRFLSSMSHDIRTPMNSIMGLTAIASMYIDDTQRVRDCLAKINMSSKHLLGLINEVLDMAKIEGGKISLTEEDFSLSDTVESLITIMSSQAEAKNIELKVNIINLEHETMVGDPMRLQQVFVNILGNAVKFTDEGGEVTMTIEEMRSKAPGYANYRFQFIDNGCGMSEELVDQVFEPFVRSTDSRISKIEGTGLGLPIVKGIVEQMNGTITVESKQGVGTTITVTVAMKLRDVVTHDTEALVGLPVLVADDDEVACLSACAMLESIGMDPEYVQSGIEAVDRVVAAHNGDEDDFVAVILDWKMQDQNGLETARRIREEVSEDVPIIILSAYDWSTIEREARKIGVNAFISKPMFRSRLVHVMRELLLEEEIEAEVDALSSCDLTGHRILLTEDNDIAAEVALDILGFTGANVERAVNGKEALRMVTVNPPGYYDLVLMDVQMPVMNGYEATRAIRLAADEGRPDLNELPIIALTADAFAEDVQKARAAGMDAHISKPIQIDLLPQNLSPWLK